MCGGKQVATATPSVQGGMKAIGGAGRSWLGKTTKSIIVVGKQLWIASRYIASNHTLM